MEKIARLISVVVIAMALMIAFSGVATASYPVPPTSETENLKITTTIISNRRVVESEGLALEIDSGDLLDNPPLADGEKYGKIRYDENMIGLSGATNFSKVFSVDTKTAPNLAVTKKIGYKQGELGSLSYDEQVGMNLIANKTPSSCEGVNVYGEMVVTDVEATTETTVGITVAPVNLNYDILATGVGLVVAGVDVYAEDGRGAALGSRWIYKDKSIAYREFTFCKEVGYLANQP
jgi:hypothetical protein